MKKLLVIMILFPVFFASSVFSQEDSENRDTLILSQEDSINMDSSGENAEVTTTDENLNDSVLGDLQTQSHPGGHGRPGRPRSVRSYKINVVDYNTTEIREDRTVFIKCHDRFDQEVKNRIPGVTFRDLEKFRQSVTRLTRDTEYNPRRRFQIYKIFGYVRTVSPTVREIGWSCSITIIPPGYGNHSDTIRILNFTTTLDPL